MNKGPQNQNQNKLAGFEKGFTSQQRAVPATYFAGTRRLEAKWISDAGDYKKLTTSVPLSPFSIPDWQVEVIGGFMGDPFLMPMFVNKLNGKSSPSATYYFASIAAELCCERLDFIYGILSSGGVLWPTSKNLQGNWYLPGKYVQFIDGNVYYTPSLTRRVPPEAPWQLVVHAKDYDWAMPAVAAGTFWIYKGKIWESTASTASPPPGAAWKLFQRKRTDLANPFKITIFPYGDCYLYWGTPDQTLGGGETFLSAKGHPPYRYRSVLVLQKFLFGTKKTAPNIEILGGRAPQQSVIVGDSAGLDADWQANPWTVIAELLTHPVIGIGLPTNLFDATSWQAEADRCYANSALTYTSEIYDAQIKVRDVVPKILETIDSFLFWGGDGKIHAGHWPHGEAPPIGLTNLSMHDFIDELMWKSGGWKDTYDSVELTFDNLLGGFQSDLVTAPNLLNRQQTHRANTLALDRKAIIRPEQATYWAAEAARIAGKTKFSGSQKVRAEKAADILPGSLFEITDDQNGVTEIARCTKKTILKPPTGEVQIEFEKERGIADVIYSPTPDNPGLDDKPAPARIEDYQLIQIPDSLAADGGNFRAAILAARADAITKSADVWWNAADGTGALSQLSALTKFAIAGLVNSSINGADVSNEQITAGSTQGNSYNTANQDFWNLTLKWKQPAHSGKIFLPTNPANNSTLVATINGTAITLTFVNTLSGVAGQVKRHATDSSITTANALDLLQHPGTTNANHVALSAGNQTLINYFTWSQGQIATTIVATAGASVTSLAGTTIPAGAGNSFLATDTFQTSALEGVDYILDATAGTVSVANSSIIPDGSTVQVSYSIYVQIAFAGYTSDDDVEGISGTLTADEIADNKMLLFLFKSTDEHSFEICSLKSVEALGGGIYRCTIRRAIYNTNLGGDGAHVWGNPDRTFIIPRAGVIPLAHISFEDLSNAGSTATFRLVPSTSWETADLTDVYNAGTNPNGLTTEFDYTFFNPYQPKLTWEELQQNGADIASFAATFSTADWFDFTIGLAAITNMATFTLVATQGSTQLQLLTTTLTGASEEITAHFQLPAGTWQLIGKIGDLQGNTLEYPLTQVGSPDAVAMTVTAGGAAPTKCSTPTFATKQIGDAAKVTIYDSTAGATILYNIVPLGYPNVGSYKTYSTPLTVGSCTIYAKAKDPSAVLADSDVAKKNII